MKTAVAGMLTVLVNCAFALTDTVDGITWHYTKGSDRAIIRSPNIDNITSPYGTLLPAHEGRLPKVLRIPNKLGGVYVYAIDMGAIQLSDDSGVELIIVPETVHEVSADAIVGAYIKCELYISTSRVTRYKWFFKNASEHGLKGVLCLGGLLGRYRSGYEVINIDSHTDIIMVGENESSDLYPQLYYVDGVVSGAARYGAAKVDIAPTGGVFDTMPEVSLSCTNSSAKIYYTLDGSDPTTNVNERCFLYDNPLTLTHGATVRALAHVVEYPYTIVYSERYALGQALLPSIVAADGNVFNWSGNMVALATKTEGAQIRYTLDGSEPTENSKLYIAPFSIDDTTTVKARAFKEDWFESETATATFTREWYTVETPAITPSDTTFANASQEVGISCDTEGATVLYTTDGSDPVANGREYKRPFKVYNTCTVRAVAVKYDWKNSEEVTATMTRGEPLSEAVNLYGYKMGTDTDKPWVVDSAVSHDSVSSIRSNGDGSYVQTSVNGKGTLSFWWRAMCEEPGYEWYDHCAFVTGGDTVSRIAGENTGWVYFSMTFSTLGKHVLRWEYHKDEEGDFYPDCVWLDQVQWIPADGSGYTLTTPEPVPYSWLMGYNLGFDSDFETAAKQATSKVDANGQQMAVWQDYVAGTDPTNPNDYLRAMIAVSNDVPIVTWTPNLNTNGEVRVYTVMGKTNLTDAAWVCPTNSGHRFFKVKVELP